MCKTPDSGKFDISKWTLFVFNDVTNKIDMNVIQVPQVTLSYAPWETARFVCPTTSKYVNNRVD